MAVTRKRVLIAVVLGVVLSALTYCISPVWLHEVKDQLSREKFSPALWVAREQAPPYRITLIDDLLRRHHLKGMTSAELDKLLGRPPVTGYFRGWDRVYWLGPERTFISIDSEWLVVDFENDRVSRYEVVHD